MKKAFTLIELLVVIAIIAILAAILFPVFAQAKDAAKKTQCASNMKNLGTAFVLYSNDYDDTLPSPGGLGGQSNAWDYIDNNGASPVLDPYIKNRGMTVASVFSCPKIASTSMPAGLAASDLFRKYPRSYGMNQYLRAGGAEGSNTNGAFVPNGKSVGEPDSCWNGAVCTYSDLNKLPYGISMTAMGYPSGTVLLYEGIPEQASDKYNGYVGRAGDWTNVGGWYTDAASCAAKSSTAYPGGGTGFPCQNPGVKAWHTERDNYAYTDTHVKSRAPEKKGQFTPSGSTPSEFLVSHCRDANAACP